MVLSEESRDIVKLAAGDAADLQRKFLVHEVATRILRYTEYAPGKPWTPKLTRELSDRTSYEHSEHILYHPGFVVSTNIYPEFVDGFRVNVNIIRHIQGRSPGIESSKLFGKLFAYTPRGIREAHEYATAKSSLICHRGLCQTCLEFDNTFEVCITDTTRCAKCLYARSPTAIAQLCSKSHGTRHEIFESIRIIYGLYEPLRYPGHLNSSTDIPITFEDTPDTRRKEVWTRLVTDDDEAFHVIIKMAVAGKKIFGYSLYVDKCDAKSFSPKTPETMQEAMEYAVKEISVCIEDGYHPKFYA